MMSICLNWRGKETTFFKLCRMLVGVLKGKRVLLFSELACYGLSHFTVFISGPRNLVVIVLYNLQF